MSRFGTTSFELRCRYEFRQACRKAGLTFREAEEAQGSRRALPDHSDSVPRSELPFSVQASIFDACAETKGKLQLPVFLRLLHGETQNTGHMWGGHGNSENAAGRSCRQLAEPLWSVRSLSWEAKW